MGYMLQVKAPVKKGLLSFSRITADQVAAAIFDGIKGTPLEPLASREKLEGNLFLITMHPAGDRLYVEEVRGRVEVEAKTSVLGPGYHAFLVSILESVQARLGLHWEWNDESGYVLDRDFGRLQANMAGFLKDLGGALLKAGETDEQAAGSSILMDPDCEFEAYGDEILAPLGPLSVRELRRWQSLNEAEIDRVAAGFYPWWDQSFDGGFYRGLALYALWNDIRWAYPLDPKEVELAKRTLHWCKEAVNRGVVDAAFQPSVIAEISSVIMAEGPRLHFPKKGGIGYRRRTVQKRYGDGWTLAFPASLGERIEHKDRAPIYVLENHVLDIRLSLGRINSAGGLKPSEMEVKRQILENREDLFLVNILARKPESKEADAACLMTVTLQDTRLRNMVDQIIDSLDYTSPEHQD
jgi:hypothetical protein